MSTTLSYGRKTFANGDLASIWWDGLNANTVLDDAHAHNGTNSAKISTINLTKTVSDISSASWVAVAGKSGTYRKSVTLPAGALFSTGVAMHFYINKALHAQDGAQVLPVIEKITDSTYYIYTNDNSLAYKVHYA